MGSQSPRTVGELFRRRSRILVASLVGSAAVAAGFGVTDLIFIAGRDGPQVSYFPGSVAGTGMELFLLVPAAVVSITSALMWLEWQYLLARVTPRRRLRRRPFWHVATWFIPIVNWWMPLQNVRDLWHAHSHRSNGRLLGWWWASWLIATLPVLPGDVDRRFAPADPWVDLVAESSMMVAAVLAIRLVRHVTGSALTA